MMDLSESKNCPVCERAFLRPAIWYPSVWGPKQYCSRHCSRSRFGDLRTRFENHIMPEPNSGCWLWMGVVNPGGYGTIQVGGSKQIVSRLSWALHRGPIPHGLDVCHKCDVRCCANPDHLFLGTARDNIMDCKRKGRLRRLTGEEHPGAKLTADQVIAIRASPLNGERLAEMFGVKSNTISMIRTRRNWRNV